MQVKRFILIAASILPVAFAQTSSDCNPLKGCFKDDPALGTTYVWDYTKNHGAAPRFDIVSSASRISYQGDGMHMSVQMKGDSPTLQSQFYIFWGRAEIVMKAGPGAGIVSSLVFQSDVLDEIDVEFIGNQPGNVQTNIFSKGNQDVHIYGANTPVADTTGVFHKYTVDWTPEQITWYIDGAVVRTLARAALGDVYPQTPMQIKFGPWAAGDPSNAPGTIEWAGGPIDYNLAPFDMVVASLTVTDYSTGATKYRYKDTSGSSASIEITGGGNSNPVPVPEPTSSAPPPPPTTTSKPPPPPPTTTSKPPPPPPTTTSTPPPPPPTTTSITTTSTTKPPPPKPTTTSSEEETETTTSIKETTTSSIKETTSSVKEETTTSYHPTKSTFIIETTRATTSSEPTGRSEQTTSTTIAIQSTNERLATNSDVPNSGSSIRTGSPLIIAMVALLVLF